MSTSGREADTQSYTSPQEALSDPRPPPPPQDDLNVPFDTKPPKSSMKDRIKKYASSIPMRIYGRVGWLRKAATAVSNKQDRIRTEWEAHQADQWIEYERSGT